MIISAKGSSVSPVVKWAGGKFRLAGSDIFPAVDGVLELDSYHTYVEPFLGGGGMFCAMLNRFEFDEVFVSDFNAELVNVYVQVKTNLSALVGELDRIESGYNSLLSTDSRKSRYLLLREEYNSLIVSRVLDARCAALFIALNKLGFNGLYRVNRSGLFNVPFGDRERASLYVEENLLNMNKLVQRVNFSVGDYRDSLKHAGDGVLYYFDPPYRPLSGTKSFTSYTNSPFSDIQQRQLASLCGDIVEQGGSFMLSNSNTEDGFFDELYEDYVIRKFDAGRSVGASSATRKKASEILVIG